MGNERISNDVQQRVNAIKQMGGDKKKIDSEAEYQALQQLSAELANTGNRFEKKHVKGLMLEYETNAAADAAKAAEKKQKNEVSDAARKDLANIKKIMSDKKELNEPEARMVLELIRNTRGDYSAAEIEYFKQELIKAGFGDWLNELGTDMQGEELIAAPKDEPVPQDEPALPPAAPEESGEGRTSVELDTPEPGKVDPKPDKPEPQPVKQGPDKEPTPKPKQGSKKLYRIADTGKEHGQRIAKDLQKEVNKVVRPGIVVTALGADNSKVAELINEVDKNTAYSFLVAYTYADGNNTLEVNRDVYGLSDMFNKITADQAKHLVSATLDQAKGMGLENTKAFQNLNNLYNGMNATLHGKSDPDKVLQRQLDNALMDMVNKMTDVIA